MGRNSRGCIIFAYTTSRLEVFLSWDLSRDLDVQRNASDYRDSIQKCFPNISWSFCLC